MSDYNGWTNYATWRVNLEMIDGLDPREMAWQHLDKADLADVLKEYCEDTLESPQATGTLALDYALAFVAEVNWREIAGHMMEAYDIDPKPFHVVGLDTDGTPTVLEQFDNSSEAIYWARKYTSKEDAGGWDTVAVDDTRDECAETLWRWERSSI